MRWSRGFSIATGAGILLLLVAVVWYGTGGGLLGGGPELRNVVVVVVDTLRQDHLQCYGYDRETAPEICRLAAEGVILDGVSPTSWTKPATASILTGLHPIRHQAIERNDRLSARSSTLADLLSEEGYTTLAVSGNGWVSEQFGFTQGFDEFFQETKRQGHPPTAEEINAVLLPELADLTPPFFLYVHYVDPHAPYDPPYSWTQDPLADHLQERAPVTNEDLQMPLFVKRDPQLMQDTLDLYDGEIRAVDSRIGELWAELERLGLTEETLVVITSDHGEEFEEHGRVGHGMSLYREVIRVPLVFHSPGLWPSGLHLGRASLMDIVPTVLDFLGYGDKLDEGDGFDGVSLLPWLAGNAGSEGALLPSEQPGYLLHLDMDGRSGLAFTAGDRKLLLAREPYSKQLFDIGSDPLEQENLMGSEAEAGRFRQISEQLADAYNQFAREELQRETVTNAAEATRAIQALGYISPSADSIKPRLIPVRVWPADPWPGGLLGWEIRRQFSSRIETSEDPLSMQLLDGWGRLDPNDRGRRVDGGATLVLRAPDGVDPSNLELQLDGFKTSAGLLRLTISLGDDLVIQREIRRRGAWTLREPVNPVLDEYSLVLLRISLETEPPASLATNDSPQPASLLVQSVCLAAPGNGP